MSITDRAHQNRQYVRGLLTQNSPEFAAVLDWVIWEVQAEWRRGDAQAAIPRQAVLSTPNGAGHRLRAAGAQVRQPAHL